MRREKRGQAAMEFLMTYGWAILAAIIVIAVIAIYFRPSSLVSDSVVVNAPFYGVGVTVSTTEISVEIRNNGGEELDLNNTAPATISFNTPSTGTCTTAATASLDPVPAGGQSILTFAGCNLNSGDTVSADVAIAYTRPGSTLELSSTGSVSGKAA